VAGAWVFSFYWLAGEFKTIEPHFSGTCKTVPGIAGPEEGAHLMDSKFLDRRL